MLKNEKRKGACGENQADSGSKPYPEHAPGGTERLREAEAAYRMHREDFETEDSAVRYGLAGYRDDGISPIPPSAKFPRQGRYTVADYAVLPDDRRFELIDGYLFELTAPGRRHQSLLGHLFAQFYACAAKQTEKRCEVLMAPFDVQLDADSNTMVQPDLVVLCGDDQQEKHAFQGAPDLVVEILSPSNRAHDTVRKFHKYRRAGVREYWIADPENRLVYVYEFEKDAPEEVYPFGSIIDVRISEGRCRIDFGEIERQMASYYR